MDGSTLAADGVIEREVRVAARPETVFAFWTDPGRMARWMGRDIRLDPRPGGELRIDYNGSDIVSGEFVELDPPTRIVLTWGWEAAGDATPPGAQHGRGRLRRRRRRHDRPPSPFRARRRGGERSRRGLGPLPAVPRCRGGELADQVLCEEQPPPADRTDDDRRAELVRERRDTSSGRPVPSSGWIRVRIRSTSRRRAHPRHPMRRSAAGGRTSEPSRPSGARAAAARCASSRSTAPATSALPGPSTAHVHLVVGRRDLPAEGRPADPHVLQPGCPMPGRKRGRDALADDPRRTDRGQPELEELALRRASVRQRGTERDPWPARREHRDGQPAAQQRVLPAPDVLAAGRDLVGGRQVTGERQAPPLARLGRWSRSGRAPRLRAPRPSPSGGRGEGSDAVVTLVVCGNDGRARPARPGCRARRGGSVSRTGTATGRNQPRRRRPLSSPARPTKSGDTPRMPSLTPRVAVVIAGLIVVGIVGWLGRDALRPFVVGLILAYILDIPVERISRRGLPRWMAVLIVYAIFVVVLVWAVRLVVAPLAVEVSRFIREFPAFMAQVADLYEHLDLPPDAPRGHRQLPREPRQRRRRTQPGRPPARRHRHRGRGGLDRRLRDHPGLDLLPDQGPPGPGAERRGRPPGRVARRRAGGVRPRRAGVRAVDARAAVPRPGGRCRDVHRPDDPERPRRPGVREVRGAPVGDRRHPRAASDHRPDHRGHPRRRPRPDAGVDAAIAAVLLYLLVQQVENNVLVPKIQGDAVELHPSVVMLALVMGGAIAGLLGAILALPVTAAARDVFRYAFHRVDDPPSTPDEAVAMIRAHPTVVEQVPDEAAGAGASAGG